MYGLSAMREGCHRSTFTCNIRDLKEYIKYMEAEAKKAQKEADKYKRWAEKDKQKLIEVEKLYRERFPKKQTNKK